MMVVNEDPRETLNRYVQWAQYPPDSRPLFGWQKDLIEPYNIPNMPLPIVDTPARGCTTNDDGMPVCKEPATFLSMKCDMNADQAVSVGTGDFHVKLFCVNEQQERLKIENIRTKIYRIWDKQEIPSSLPAVHVGDDGSSGDEKAGDLVYTITVRPTKSDWGDMFVEADFRVNGKDQNQRAGWYSTPHDVASFESGISDRSESGNLVVMVPIQIKKAGYFLIEANLQEKNDPQRFLATASYEGKIEAGRQTIPLRFFGKILRDQNVDGPYIVREIRGRRNNSPVTPDMVQKSLETGEELHGEHTEPLWEFMKMAPQHETEAYEAKSFSKEEWNSDEKRRRIEFLEKLSREEG
ncbi:MAG: hypothetical protein H3C43_06485 [Leptonema sp. (in: Bacteria)]|nr:hypothetical protein [Leptonema sp. (in: bacteria)]